ncbi:MAG: sugar phosphorylase [Chloroflexota bacterium]
MNPDIKARVADKLQLLYHSSEALVHIQQLLEDYPIAPRGRPGSHETPILIAYGDHIQHDGDAPLQILQRFAHEALQGIIGGIHLLPFYPYTSDDGFSVVDYLAVNPSLGTWSEIELFRGEFRLMFDLVLNHASVSCDWFQRFLRNEAPYNDYFVTAAADTNLSAVVRPRTHPLLTPFETAAGTRYVWTTFSADQVDLNFANPAVLLEFIRILLEYVQRGADYIRLDAVAFLWKTIGTSCIHLPQTHTVIQLMRDVLDEAAPWVKLISETNVPHQENLLYFGDGENEAQLVYQFALPPLLLHTFYTSSARTLSVWAAGLNTPSPNTSFFNFTASHDGIGVRPVADILSPADIGVLLETVQQRGGQISYRSNSDGTKSAYELNITYFDALAEPGEPLAQSVDRFITSQAIMLALSGLPGIYLPSLFGAANWDAGAAQTGCARSINREKFELSRLAEELNTPESRYAQVFDRYKTLLRVRGACSAFDWEVPQRILDLDSAVFAVERGGLIALHNVSQQIINIRLPDDILRHDLLSDRICQGSAVLHPYQTQWLESKE